MEQVGHIQMLWPGGGWALQRPEGLRAVRERGVPRRARLLHHQGGHDDSVPLRAAAGRQFNWLENPLVFWLEIPYTREVMIH